MGVCSEPAALLVVVSSLFDEQKITKRSFIITAEDASALVNMNTPINMALVINVNTPVNRALVNRNTPVNRALGNRRKRLNMCHFGV